MRRGTGCGEGEKRQVLSTRVFLQSWFVQGAKKPEGPPQASYTYCAMQSAAPGRRSSRRGAGSLMASFWQKTKRSTDGPKSRKGATGTEDVVPEIEAASEAVSKQEQLAMEPMAVREAIVVTDPASNVESDVVQEGVLTQVQLQSDTGIPFEAVVEDMELGEMEVAVAKTSSRTRRRAVAIEEHMDVEVDGVGVIGVGDDVYIALREDTVLDPFKLDDVGLARVEGISLDKANDAWKVQVVWFYRPEDTHVGRLNTHHKKELFISQHRSTYDVDCVYRKCRILTANEFRCGVKHFKVGGNIACEGMTGDCEGHSDICTICGSPGELLCCDGVDCPTTAHPGCVGIPSDAVESLDTWMCPGCLTGAGRHGSSSASLKDVESMETDLWFFEYEYNVTWQRFSKYDGDRLPANGKGHAGGEDEDGACDSGVELSDDEFVMDHADDDDAEYDEEVQRGKDRLRGTQSGKRGGNSLTNSKLKGSRKGVRKGGGNSKGTKSRAQRRVTSYVKTLAANSRHSRVDGKIFGMGMASTPRVLIDGVPEKESSPGENAGISPFAAARDKLKLNNIPTGPLPCREVEREEIYGFVKRGIEKGGGGSCMYISGVPGTGKTATVLEVMGALKRRSKGGRLAPFTFVEVNSLRLPTPQHAYTVLWEALSGSYASPPNALDLLDAHFAASEARVQKGGGRGRKKSVDKSRDRQTVVVMVDEVDLLLTRTQSVLYNLFDWPCREGGQMIVIAIANTMDLPERFLPRVASRLGMHRLTFAPYAHAQINAIIRQRLANVDECFEPNAVELVSRRVAAASGDVRRALEICRLAAERKEASGLGSKITMAEIQRTIKEMYTSAHIEAVRRLTVAEKIILASMLILQRTAGVEDDVTFADVIGQAERMATANGVDGLPADVSGGVLGSSEEQHIYINRLGRSRLILSEPGRKRSIRRLSLNCSLDDVVFALRDDPALPWLSKIAIFQ